MTIITLTSDFGLLDPYVGIMKGVILSIAPHVRLVDLSHDLHPQDIEAAAFVLESVQPYFPPGTVHLAVIDPGVGSARRALLVTTELAAFVGPDNGLFSAALAQRGARAWALDRPEYWLPQPGSTFHGRDIFAPVAARFASGAPAEMLGTPLDDPVMLPARMPERTGNDEIAGCVIHVDRFGNLITNVPGEWLAGRYWTCEIAGARIGGPSPTYAAADPGGLLVLISSRGTAEVAVREGSAAERLAVRSGAVVRFIRTKRE